MANLRHEMDTLNLIPIFDNGLKEYFKVFSPERMMIDNNNGKFNSSLGIDKDQMLGIWSLCN